MELELAARRLRWLQIMLRAPEDNGQVIAAIWGQLALEADEYEMSPLDEAGRLTAEATSLAQRIAADVIILCDMGLAEQFGGWWEQEGEGELEGTVRKKGGP